MNSSYSDCEDKNDVYRPLVLGCRKKDPLFPPLVLLTCTWVLYNSWMSKSSMFKWSFSLQSSHVVMASRFVANGGKNTPAELADQTVLDGGWRSGWGGSSSFTWADFGAKPPLDAFLVNVLQTARTTARLDQGVGGGILAHLADAAHVAFVLIRILQQQSTARKKSVGFFFFFHLNYHHTAR